MQKARVLGVSGLLLFAVLIAAGQNNNDSARRALEEARQAAGGDAWSRVGEIVTEGKLQAAWNSGPLRYVEHVATGRNVLHYEFDSGSRETRGTDLHGFWEQDANGYISIFHDLLSKRNAIDDRYLAQRAYWQPESGGAAVAILPSNGAEQSRYERIEVKPQGGHGFILWINRQTHLIERVEHKRDRPYTEFWSDYREVRLPPPESGSIRLPFKVSIQPGAEQFVYTTRQVLEKSRSADFVIPFQHDYQLPPGGKVMVPFFSSTGIILKARINGQGPFTVVLDSGASVNLISSEVARRLGLKLGEQMPIAGMSDSVTVQHTAVKSVQIGGLMLRNQPFEVIDVPYGLSRGSKEPLVAVIGYPVFRRLAIQINYHERKVTFYDGPSFRHQGHATEVPMHISHDWLVADGTVQGVPGMFSLDTGQENVALNLFHRFVQRTAIDKKLGKSFCGVAGEGFGGAQHGCFTRSKLALGNVAAGNLVTTLSHDTSAISSTTTIAGNIGTGFFRKFTVTFDAIHQKLFLEKNQNYPKRDVYNRAGMVLQLVPGGEKVLNVFSGGPAATAGIQPGDVLTSIKGHRPSEPAIAIRQDVFRQPVGTVVHATVQRGNSSRNLRMILKDVL
jgi:aspartyl protease